jgi:UDP-glucose 4-epimerase
MESNALSLGSSNEACLVIGGTGFVGKQLVTRLVKDGVRVTVVGRRALVPGSLPPGVTYIGGDFGSLELIRPLIAKHQNIIHLAYATVPNTSFENPLRDLMQNLAPAVQLFQVVAEFDRRLVFVSSGGTIYGEALKIPIGEDHPTRPISPYGVTKQTLERYAYLYAATHGLRVTCLRPGNPYGEGQLPFTGQGFIATAMMLTMRGQPVQVFGQHGSIRDYFHVEDLVDAIIRVLGAEHSGQTYNVGSGIGRSNLDVLTAMSPLLAELGKKVQIIHQPERVFDVRVNILDSGNLSRRTGWKLDVGFEEGLLRTFDWLKSSCLL